MKRLDIKTNILILILVFIIVIILTTIFHQRKEKFVYSPCLPNDYWDTCLDKCELLYDQSKSQICKNRCNEYLMKKLKNSHD